MSSSPHQGFCWINDPNCMEINKLREDDEEEEEEGDDTDLF